MTPSGDGSEDRSPSGSGGDSAPGAAHSDRGAELQRHPGDDEGGEPDPVIIEGHVIEIPEETVERIVETALEIYHGPLPSPRAMEGYEAVTSGSADRILRMVEEQSQHRRESEKLLQEGNEKRANRGQFLALIAFLAVVLAGYGVAVEVNVWAGVAVLLGAFGAATLIAVIGGQARPRTFIARGRQTPERADIDEAIDEARARQRELERGYDPEDSGEIA